MTGGLCVILKNKAAVRVCFLFPFFSSGLYLYFTVQNILKIAKFSVQPVYVQDIQHSSFSLYFICFIFYRLTSEKFCGLYMYF